MLFVYWSGTVSALPFTYDFGFNGEETGFSGVGSFTLSQLVGAPGLDAFEFTGVCAGYTCGFAVYDISDVSWTVNPDGVVSALSISAEYYTFESSTILRNFLSMNQNSLSTSWECANITGPFPNPIENCGFANRSSLYESGGTFLTLREESTPTPLPSTLFLFSAGLASIYFFLGKRILHQV